VKLEPLLNKLQPDWVVTVGDVNSTAAAALVSVKLGLKTVHVEAGLRSFDRTMPEEINRLITDSISDLLFVTEQSGVDNLLREGVEREKIHLVGNTMIDTLINLLPEVKKIKAWEKYNLQSGNYIVVTLHRPSNVDKFEVFSDLIYARIGISTHYPIIFPVHPRTRKNLDNFGFVEKFSKSGNIILTEPMDYLSFISLVSQSRALMTDSGGIQEETTYLGIPCSTLRENTERPVTIEKGTNRLVYPIKSSIKDAFDLLITGRWKKGTVPPLWDGHTSQRIINILQNYN